MEDDFLVEQYQGVDIICCLEGYYAWIDDRRIGTHEARSDVRTDIDAMLAARGGK